MLDPATPIREHGWWLAALSKFFWILIGLAIGAALSTPVTESVSWATWHVTNITRNDSPTCADPGWYHEVKPVDTEAYSTYPPEKGISYRTGNTVDNERTTAWVGRFTKNANYDWIAWRFPKAVNIRLICIRNGLTDNYGSYAGNGRVKTAQLTGCGDSKRIAFTDHVNLISRTLDAQWTDFKTVAISCTSDRIRLTPTSIFAANDNSSLAAISDIQFYQGWHFSD